MITSVRVREALDAVGSVVTNLTLAIRGASAVTLLSAILVLGGALAAGPSPPGLRRGDSQDPRRHAGCGCSAPMRWNIMMIGFATAVFGVHGRLDGGVADRHPADDPELRLGGRQRSAGVVLAALIVTVGLGLAGTLVALNQKPATVLRNL